MEELTKILIYAYNNRDFSKLADIDKNPIHLPINPESFEQEYGIKFNVASNLNETNSNTNYIRTSPKELMLAFIFDGTESVLAYKYNSDDHSVKSQLKIFNETIYHTDNQGNIRPRYLHIKWGESLSYYGFISNLKLNYTLFQRNGDPLRIEVEATFISDTFEEQHTHFIEREMTTSMIKQPIPLLVDEYVNWDNIVFDKDITSQINDLINWVKFKEKIHAEWEFINNQRLSYLSLFQGPLGTGKKTAAKLIGNLTNSNVYHFALPYVISNYIGETEKNINDIFQFASESKSILFFDEADAIFGKRTNVKDAHNKYANQEVAYLIQRIEAHNGLVIISSNTKGSFENSIMRYFQSVIYFPLPNLTLREVFWKRAFPERIKLESSINFNEIANNFELSVKEINAVAEYCLIKTEAIDSNVLDLESILYGIQIEIEKRNWNSP